MISSFINSHPTILKNNFYTLIYNNNYRYTMSNLLNPNPTIYSVSKIQRNSTFDDDEDVVDEFDSLEIFGNYNKIKIFLIHYNTYI